MKDLIIAGLVVLVLLAGVFGFTQYRSRAELAVNYDDLNDRLYDANDALVQLNQRTTTAQAVAEGRVAVAREVNKSDLKAAERLLQEKVPEGMDACLAAAAIIERELGAR